MTEFDALKAAREILASMIETESALVHMERDLLVEVEISERRLNHVRKVLGFIREYAIAPQRAKVAELAEGSK
jgi:hypothetical protein